MTRSTGTLYLSQTEGPGDYNYIVNEHAWLFEFGFYAAGRYFFLREEPGRLARLHPVAAGYGGLAVIIGLAMTALGTSDLIRLAGLWLAPIGVLLWAWGSRP